MSIVLIAIDATCPQCKYPEVTGVLDDSVPEIPVYYCKNVTDEGECGWSDTERPE